MRWFVSLLSGGLFGTGLVISGMVDTSRVQGWLDIFGDWDPTLAFVLTGAIMVMAPAWMIARRARHPLAGGAFPGAPSRKITPGLAAGSLLFGAGWGLAGLCPGPAMASLSYNGTSGLVFVASMVGGMILAVPAKRALPQLA